MPCLSVRAAKQETPGSAGVLDTYRRSWNVDQCIDVCSARSDGIVVFVRGTTRLCEIVRALAPPLAEVVCVLVFVEEVFTPVFEDELLLPLCIEVMPRPEVETALCVVLLP